MRYPYERFLRFLVSRRVEINSTLERYGLPHVGGIWIAECRTDLRNTAPVALVNYLNSEDGILNGRDGVLEWAAEQGIKPLWQMQKEFGGRPPPAAFETAFKLFVNPFSRAVLGLLLLSRANESDIQEILQERFDVGVDAETTSIYKRIFWDVELMGRKTWGTFIENLKSKEERNYIAFGLGSPSVDEIRDMLGLETALDHNTIVDQIVSKSYLEWKRRMDEPNPEQSGAMRWAELTLKAIGTSKANAPKPTDNGPINGGEFKNLFSIQPTKSNHPSLADLAGQVAIHESKTKEEG